MTRDLTTRLRAVAGPLWRRARASRWLIPGAVMAVVIVAALAAVLAGSAEQAPTALAPVQRGPLIIGVSEAGVVQNRERVIVKNEVEGNTTILWLIPEGTQVKAGDRLVDLDASKLQDEKAKQAIVVMNAESAWIRARENLGIITSQGEIDINKADLDLKLAQRDLTKYLEGEYPRDKQKCQADIQLTQEELGRSLDKLDWSRRLAGEQYITRTELRADEAAWSKSKINLELAEGALKLLEEHTYPRTVQKLASDVDQAQRTLDRVTRKAKADILQTEAELKAKESEYLRQQDLLTKGDDKIAKCRITAPVDGMVIYATTGRERRWNEEPLAEGRQIRERQELIHLPTTNRMMAEIKVHESALRKVKLGLPVRVTVDAMPDQIFWGTVAKIGLLPDAQFAWMNPDLKVYTTEVHIQDGAGVLQAGMSCKSEVIVEQYSDALQVPVQSVVRVGDQTMVYVQTPGGPRQRAVQAGLDNGQFVHVLSGLDEGEQVLLAPPLEVAAAAQEKKLDVPPASMPAQAADATSPPADPTSQPASAPAQLAGIPAGPAKAAEAVPAMVEEPAPASQPATQPATQPASQPGDDLVGKLLAMSQEQRREYFRNLSREQRAELMQNLTPEQREQLGRLGGPRADREGRADVPREGRAQRGSGARP